MQNGVVTLDDSALWLVERAILIASGTQLLIGEGAQVQVGQAAVAPSYAEETRPSFQVEGVLSVVGTEDSPARIFPSELSRGRGVPFVPTSDGTISIRTPS